ncbi:MAG: hypothetical protein KatS3mg016_0822 [Fimbriimonadales bacterium]|nr:MAG: hypothetical protein KatS3mg016_0822 [Fimbriimonadales bacterium]
MSLKRQGATVGWVYTYDGLGRRVRAQLGSNVQEFLYGAGDSVLAERANGGAWVVQSFGAGLYQRGNDYLHWSLLYGGSVMSGQTLRWVRRQWAHSRAMQLFAGLLTVALTLWLPHSGFTAWGQDGYFTYEVVPYGTERRYIRSCEGVLFDHFWPLHQSDRLIGVEWFTDLDAVYADAWARGTVKFIIYWHGSQAPDPYLALRYYEWARLGVATPATHGRATANFRGNVGSSSVSVQAGGGQCGFGICTESREFSASEVHAFYLNFTRVDNNLWKAELSAPFRAEVKIEGSCPPPPLGVSSGITEARASVAIVDNKFIYIIAENEPSYHKKDDCAAAMNNSSGRLDDRYGDTVIELYAERGFSEPSFVWTDWYLGNRMVYTRVLHGNWCEGDCPLNEWWICGAYYKDNLFHEFTSVNAVIGFPISDCEKWYIGTEWGWNDAPGLEFWSREDVQRRVASVLGQLPFKYEVKLKVTDDEGNGFSDRANYTMTVHAPLELTKLVETYDTFLPEEDRSHRHEFIPLEAYGAVRISEWRNNYSRTDSVTESSEIQREDTFTSAISANLECSASGNVSVPLLGIKLTGAKFGIGTTISTSTRYQVGTRVSYSIPPRTRRAIFSQRAATVEKWLADIYDRNGYQGTGLVTAHKDIRFEYVYWEEPIP